ncbi:pentapeptide repeat-containing protein [Stenomitos frigidus]|uniref:Pentapeptide repeat-containing protein n=1 Tax=Stenomitos frigidus ULC18 TaxID=2107698 RepID=A0A2T1E1G6_9CYAN|nr:pentapeptide repeat-containing protein [Stenomitos frigidus]PSB26588.1 pentapeptide repeat-containing protein [Stenomitos frigidus ULC18]
MSSRQVDTPVSQQQTQWLAQCLAVVQTAVVQTQIWQQKGAIACFIWGGLCIISLWIATPLPAFADDYNRDFLVGADFSGKNLIDSSFTKANLRGSNFSHSDLHGVSFFGANLEGANFEGADLRNATLDAVRFTDANLTNANLEGAFAFNAKFGGTIIDGADFTNVDVRQDAQTLLCQSAKGKNPVTGRETRRTLNCD